MYEDEFYKLLSRTWFGEWQTQLIDCVMKAGRQELGTSLVESLITSWTIWRGKKNASTLQNENCDYVES